MYGDLLNAAPGGPPGIGAPPQPPAAPSPMGAPPGAALGVGAGPVPKMPGLPPPPTNVGAMPTGDPSTNKKESADNAILALREVKGHYPSLGPVVDQAIDQIKSAAKAGGPKSVGLGAPAAPGAMPPETPDTTLSGSPGGF